MTAPRCATPDRRPPASGLSWRRLGRRVAVTIVLLAATEWAVRNHLPAVRYDAAFNLPSEGLGGAGAFVAQIKARAAAGARVVVILGDSTTLIAVPNGTRNLSAELAAQLAAAPGWPPAEIYNLSAPGLDPASHYYLARELAPFVRALIVPVNFRIFSTGSRAQIPYPELWHELRPAVTDEERAHLVLERGQGAGGPLARVEAWCDAVADGALSLKRRPVESRALMQGWLNPRSWFPGTSIAPASAPIPDSEHPLREWLPDARARVIRFYAMSYRHRRFTPDNADVYFLRRLFELSQSTPCLIVGYAAPVSRWLNAREHFLDWDDYASNVALIRPLAAGARAVFLDYNAPATAFDPAPGDQYFQSPEHLVDAGIRLFVGRLMTDLGPRLRESLQ